jgi:hypothetical protein
MYKNSNRYKFFIHKKIKYEQLDEGGKRSKLL